MTWKSHLRTEISELEALILINDANVYLVTNLQTYCWCLKGW